MGLLDILADLTHGVTAPYAVQTELEAGRALDCDLPSLVDLDWIRLCQPISAPALPLAADLGPRESAVLALALESASPLKVKTAQNRIVDQLRRGLDPDAIYLFGSHSRGDAGADSDLDFLVILRESDHPRSKRAHAARKVVTDRSIAKDILVMTQEEWKRGLKVVPSLPTTVVREGTLLYER